MSAEDELLPQQHIWPTVDPASGVPLAEFWDDAESDQHNLEIIRWWLSIEAGDPHRDSR